MRNAIHTTLAYLALGLLLGLLHASHVSAQIRGVRPEGHLNLGLSGHIGLGARIDIPIVPEGFLPDANDELALSPGADLLFKKNSTWIGLPIAAQWNFYITHEWSVFPELGLVMFFGDRKGNDDVDLDFLAAVGGRYHLNDRNALVLRLGWPFGLQFGVTF